MKEVYLDNAATSRDKPESVLKAINDYYQEIGCSPGRGGYECSLAAGRLVLETRLSIAELFEVATPEQVVFTHNVTHALNYALKGFLESGDHVITTSMEHNAVVRPLQDLAKAGLIEVDYIAADSQGMISPEQVAEAIQENTKLLVTTHASNVAGTLLPIAELANLAKQEGLLYILDTAQTAGVYDLNFSDLDLDVLAFTGHKGLLGPTGTGGFVISKEAAKLMDTLIEGGTGSISDREYQPDFLPDKFESGTLNTMGLAGLKAGVDFIKKEGLKTIREHELDLTKRLIEGFKSLAGVSIQGPGSIEEQTSTVSITVEGVDLGELSFILDDEYEIMTRSGLHCAPLAHKTIGTFPEGTLRFSIGYFNTPAEIDYTLASLEQILKEY
ncbi:aminotransferase class V-fold PLP-dependent enzyme [Fuchsiella alkaliacetigena]|uniref:aminotransferase class V-fold PLP-dependent enzyme n=1 Tax=Fuchsiella alkaliacetigena TaxID=957042 RepID=UPI00200B7DAD|nr:aminotransferase class V-fold PLP-dependent enzyme [Fuchsiella alkaliacetigena]MCK8825332.1 aminotransferase class V-fold PLP-dependent enzyme [Fuchsiella alkaliacetigena]